jgi:hypothetical protein
VTSAYEQNRRNLQKSRNIDPERWNKQLETGKRFITETAKELTKPENIQEMLVDMAIDSSIFLKSDNPYSAFRTILARRGTKFLLNKADIPTKVAKNYNDLNRLTQLGEEITRKTGIENVARDSGVVQFINQDPNILDSFTKGSISYNKLDEIRARYPNRSIYEKPTGRGRESRQPFIKEHELESAKAGGKIPYFLGDDSKLYFLDTKKLDQYGPGQHRYAMVDLQNKLANEAAKRATKLSKTIPIEDYILELGEELGTKAFKINKAKMKKLYRWVSEEGAHLDHMWPLVSTPTEGFHHINNLILLYSKHNLKKSNRVLPKALFEELGIPMSKRDLIRSTLEKPKTTNKFKRRRILEELGILEIK